MARLNITLGITESGATECLYAGDDGQASVDAMSASGSERFQKFYLIRNPTFIRKNNAAFVPGDRTAPAIELEQSDDQPDQPDKPRRGRPPKQQV